MSDITATITSCGRFDLLKRTLDSFLKYSYEYISKHPDFKILISEDSTKLVMKEFITSNYPQVELIFNETNQGLLKSLDNLYNKVDTKYIFSMEDDFEFFDFRFLEQSRAVLEENKNIHQVWLRSDVPEEWIEKEVLQTSDGIKYRMIKLKHLDQWDGFSFNTALKRKLDYNLMFQNGYQAHHIPELPVVHSEYACAQHSSKFNYRAAILVNRACKHIGDGHTTETKNDYLILTNKETLINGVIYKVAYIRK